MTFSPGTYDIVLYQGTTFTEQLTWKDSSGDPVDLTGWTARMMARESVDAETAFITLTTENDGIALGGAAGTITLSMTDADTSALSIYSGIYDLELISDSGDVFRLLQGNLTVSREVTR